MNNKVLIITYYWPPAGGAGVQRWLKLSKYLPKHNIEPLILTPNENYASYPVIDQTLNEEVPESVKVFKTKSFEPLNLYAKYISSGKLPYGGMSNIKDTSIKQKLSQFIRGNFFIPDVRKGWNRYALRKASELINSYGIKTVITTSPPHSTQLIGLKLKHRYGLNWIADLRDPWTDVFYYNQFFHTAIAKKIDASLEKKVLETADSVITVSESIKNLFNQKSKLNLLEKITVIPNGYDEEDFKEQSIQEHEGEFIITYTGSIADNYKPEIFLDTFKNLVDQNSKINLKLKFVGSLSDRIKSYINKIRLTDNIEIIPPVNHKRSIQYLMESTALLMIIPDVENNEGILTGKLFEYLASKKPIICIGPKYGDAAKIIEECMAGKTFERNETVALSRYMKELISKMEEDIPITGTEKITEYSRKNQAALIAHTIKRQN